MRYKTSTVSRRMAMVKVKAKPGSGTKAPSAQRSAHGGSHAGMATVPLLFNRSDSPRSPLVPPPLSKRKWRAGIFITPLVLIALFGLYKLIALDSQTEESRSARGGPPAAGSPALPILRPMGLSSSRASTVDGTRQAVGMVSGGAPGMRVGGAVTTGVRSANSDSPGVEAESVLDGRRKYVLPADVSGNCDIGEGGVKDLGACMAQAGASVR